MSSLKLLSLMILSMMAFPIFAAAGPRSLVSLASGAVRIEATIYRQEGQGSGATELLSFRSPADGKLLWAMNSSSFERPVLFAYHGEHFVHVSTTPEGSGGFATDSIFWIAPDSTMHEIGFESAAEGYEGKVDVDEMVLTGGSGIKSAGGKLRFEFYIANDGDPHCCPTAGRVTGGYEILGRPIFDPVTKQYSSTFKMVALHYSRTPISPSEMTASFAR